MNTVTNTSKPTDVPAFVDRIVRPLTHLFKSELPAIVRFGSALAGMHKVLRMRPVAKG